MSFFKELIYYTSKGVPGDFFILLKQQRKVEVCDATAADSSNCAGSPQKTICFFTPCPV
jgi:hypothetical protein